MTKNNYEILKDIDYKGFRLLGLLWTDFNFSIQTVFKSFVSTNFTTRALMNFMSIYANIYN